MSVNTKSQTMTEKLIGYGKSFASFGEIVQGRLSNGEDFLVTIPVDMWSTCELVCEPIDGPSFVDAKFSKSREVSEHLLEVLGMSSGVKISIDFIRNIPIGKGLSSSTADMLAVIRAFQEVFGIIITENFISRLFAKIEPHDGLHYYMSVAYNHRQGNLLSKLNYIPDFNIIAVDAGGELSTEEYNKNLNFTPELLDEYDKLYNELLLAFAKRDDVEIAQCAQKSTELHVNRTGNAFLTRVLKKADEVDVLGILTTHSGTCAGFILSGNASNEELELVETKVAKIGHVFRTKTLKMLL
ncbi:kinase [Candidatus Thiomargarita nelsonii]|uniref:Kinase n=1 Tax=Candidatus Thiomargarita nelsonii TaxID=1003181 RepID=A0A176S7H4_9GAMM|nr:kinase [Candidatus Thiomargarita nelsonii]